MGFGRHLLREQLAERPGVPIDELLLGVGGVRIVHSQGYPLLETTRGAHMQCRTRVYVDGGLWPFWDEGPGGGPRPEVILEFFDLRSEDIEAIEVYRSAAEVPGVFSGPGAACGVIAVWRRRRDTP
jgi:hypothetical protein